MINQLVQQENYERRRYSNPNIGRTASLKSVHYFNPQINETKKVYIAFSFSFIRKLSLLKILL